MQVAPKLTSADVDFVATLPIRALHSNRCTQLELRLSTELPVLLWIEAFRLRTPTGNVLLMLSLSHPRVHFSGGMLDGWPSVMECPFCQSHISSHSKQCRGCGKAIPPSQRLLEESGVIEATTPESSALAAGGTARTQLQYRFARLGDRFIAFVLDTTFLFGLFATADAWVFTRWGSVDGSELRLTAASLLIAVTLNATVLFLYGWLMEALCGATLGKAMVGINVTGTTRPRSFSACAVRNLLRIVDGLAFYLVGTVLAGCSTVRQRVGDIYARTVVIEDSFGTGIRTAAVVIWIAILAGAGWAVPHICSANQSIRPVYLSQVIVQVGRSETSAYFKIGGSAVHVQFATPPTGS